MYVDIILFVCTHRWIRVREEKSECVSDLCAQVREFPWPMLSAIVVLVVVVSLVLTTNYWNRSSPNDDDDVADEGLVGLLGGGLRRSDVASLGLWRVVLSCRKIVTLWWLMSSLSLSPSLVWWLLLLLFSIALSMPSLLLLLLVLLLWDDGYVDETNVRCWCCDCKELDTPLLLCKLLLLLLWLAWTEVHFPMVLL